jgi:glycosyltransferase involved in cell wall biosynthesis
MGGPGALRTVLRVWRAEGLRASYERAVDRFLDRRRADRCQEVAPDLWRRRSPPAPILNVLPTPPAVRLGGVAIQAVRRLEAEARRRPVRLLYPERRGFRLEAWGERICLAQRLSAPSFDEALRQALEHTQATAIHVENAAGVDAAELLRAAAGARPLLLSLHDFTLFCPRTALIEQPAGISCGGSLELARCGRCLAHDGRGDATLACAWREDGARVLRAARALVFPSEFARARLTAWLAAPAGVEQAVIAPASLAARTPSPALSRAPVRARHAAYVGAVRDDKGAAVFADVVARLRGRGFRFSAYGGGDPGALGRLRSVGVRVRGYYRAGTLPERLARDGVDVALLLSVGAETYGLTLDECVAAGVPAVVFDVGAPAERVRRWSAGVVVPVEEGAEGVVRVLREIDAWPRVAPPPDLPTPDSAADAHLALYARLGLL